MAPTVAAARRNDWPIRIGPSEPVQQGNYRVLRPTLSIAGINIDDKLVGAKADADVRSGLHVSLDFLVSHRRHIAPTVLGRHLGHPTQRNEIMMRVDVRLEEAEGR
jgi:hypothetical protein